MTRTIFNKVVFVFVFAVSATVAGAQITVKAMLDKNKILIGEQIRLTLEADIPENELIRFFTIDTLPHFEILEKQKTDTSNTTGGTFLKQVIILTSFDSGHWVIPALSLGDKIITDSIPVDVGFTENFDPAKDYHDIKDILDVKPKEKKKDQSFWYIAAGGLLVLLILLVYWLTRKKKPAAKVAAQTPTVNAYEEAMKQLEKIQSEKLDQKQYYSRLVDILRLYVYRKKGIHSLQKTTDDLVMQLKDISISKELFEKLSQALRLTDFVKFAKYTPGSDDDKATFEIIKKTIVEIEQHKDAL